MKNVGLTLQISFFICLCCFSCKKSEDTREVTLIFKDARAVGLTIRNVEIGNKQPHERLQVQLIQPDDRRPVLGSFKSLDGNIIFEPLVPFTNGLRYALLIDDSLIAEVDVPLNQDEAPRVVAIYPTSDTLPENLLKIYLEFSQPMEEGRSLDHVTVIRNGTDTLHGTFLALQPELWDQEGTVLTLWLDPGRIKRDLIPNREMGAPLISGETYTLVVDSLWQSKSGLRLANRYQKTFLASARDDISPNLSCWTVIAPERQSKRPLTVTSPEPLDNFLFKNTLTIVGGDGGVISGRVEISNREKLLQFFPDEQWDSGTYVLSVQARIEDLAGNNLNRPFDRVVEANAGQAEQAAFTKEFQIE